MPSFQFRDAIVAFLGAEKCSPDNTCRELQNLWVQSTLLHICAYNGSYKVLVYFCTITLIIMIDANFVMTSWIEIYHSKPLHHQQQNQPILCISMIICPWARPHTIAPREFPCPRTSEELFLGSLHLLLIDSIFSRASMTSFMDAWSAFRITRQTLWASKMPINSTL